MKVLFMIVMLCITTNVFSQNKAYLYFDYNSDTLNVNSQTVLTSLLSNYKPEYIDISVYCSTCPIGDAEYNTQLAHRRIVNVTKYIRKHYNIHTLRIEVVNLGEGITTNDRKCEVVITQTSGELTKKYYIILN